MTSFFGILVKNLVFMFYEIDLRFNQSFAFRYSWRKFGALNIHNRAGDLFLNTHNSIDANIERERKREREG